MTTAPHGSNFGAGFVQERLDKTLAIAKDLGAQGCEALFDGFEGDLVRLAEARIAQASHLVRGQVRARVVHEGRSGSAWTSDLTDGGLRDAVTTAYMQAKLTPPTEDKVVLPQPAGAPPSVEDAIDPETALLTAAEKEAWLHAGLEAHRNDKLALAGRFHTGLFTKSVRSSTGVTAFHQGSSCDLALSSLEVPAGHKASSFRARLTARADAETVARLVDDVRAECHRATDPVEVETGAWDVILTPAAMADIMDWFCHIGFSSQFFEDGRSFAAGKLGKRVTGSAFTLVDDGRMPGSDGVPMPFDAEGLPKRRVELVDAGIVKGIVHNSRSASKQGCASTGHATADPMWPSASSAAKNPIMSAGTQTTEGLVSQVERGLLVTRLHYVNGLLDPRRAVMTGLLRDAAFLIEGGKIKRAVRPMRFTDSMLDAFSRIDGPQSISAEREPQMVGYSSTSCALLPSVLIRGLNFTSGR